MSHYFSSDEPAISSPQSYNYAFGDNIYHFTTDAGVFSVGKMDSGTDALLRNIPPLQGSLLDMGCGYGCLGIVLAKEYGLSLTQADINPRALRLCAKNAAKNGIQSKIIQSDKFDQISELFDTIAINPPIHAGKQIIFDMYEGARQHLKPSGSLYIVIQKKHGAESSLKRLSQIFGNYTILSKKKGRYIIKSSQSAIL